MPVSYTSLFHLESQALQSYAAAFFVKITMEVQGYAGVAYAGYVHRGFAGGVVLGNTNKGA